MDKVLATALLTTAAVVASVMIINALLPSVTRGTSSIQSSSESAASQIETSFEIIAVDHPTSTIVLWIKNVGSTNIAAIQTSDLFLETSGGVNFTRMTYEDPQLTTDTWRYVLEDNETVWKPSNTMKIVITLANPADGQYEVTFNTYNGVQAKKKFGT